MEDPPLPPSPRYAADRRRCGEYLLALEEERRKIEVFKRELPLCLQLVTETIEGIRSRMHGGGVGSEETVSDHGGPVLEEFMPLKPTSLSLSSDDDDEHESGAHDHDAAATTNNDVGKKEMANAETHGGQSPPPTETNNKAMPDWLKSVQLWSQQEPQHQELRLCKPVALNASRKAGGAFQPFEKEKQRAELMPASPTTAAASSSAVVGDSSCDKVATDASEKHSEKEMNMKEPKDKGKCSKDEEGQSSQATNRKPRRCWAPELHRRFLQALQQLGGSHVATPKQIREVMKVDGLTNDEVKSHLQKYRLHTRRPMNSTAAAAVQSSTSASAAQPAPQFVVVGGIWVPPPEYAAAAAAAAAASAQSQVRLAGDASGTTASTVYAPVATLPSGAAPHSRQDQQRQSSRSSGGRRSGDNASSDSPAVSSSSHTISA